MQACDKGLVMLQGLTDTVKRYARPAKDEYREGMTLLDVVKKVCQPSLCQIE